MLFRVWGPINDNDFALLGSIFFFHASNKLYWNWLSVDIRYIEVYDTLWRQANKLSNHRNEISAVKITKSVWQPTIMTLIIYNCLCWASINVFITNLYVNNEHLFIHSIPKAILKMLATENDVDGW